MTPRAVVDLLVALRNLGPVVGHALEVMPEGSPAERVVLLDHARRDTLAAIAAHATPRKGNDLGDLLVERKRFAEGGQP
jgi:hypothetical protein